jgi:hypothetical protein
MRNFLERNIFTEGMFAFTLVMVVLFSIIFAIRADWITTKEHEHIMTDKGYVWQPARWVKESEVSE